VGKKISKAFEWKAQRMKNEEIILKLRAMGVPMYKQQLIESKHEKLISTKLFLKVSNISSKSFGYGVPQKKKDKNIPLKIFTGYIVKAKKNSIITNAEPLVANAIKMRIRCTRFLKPCYNNTL
jgi:hypothetical protein